MHTVGSVEAERAERAEDAALADPTLAIAAPRRVNVMAGTYTPPRGPALRAGACHGHIASHGHRC